MKGCPKDSGTLPASHPVYAAKNFFKWPPFNFFCSPDSYNPCNSSSNKHCYVIMHLSVVCQSRIGCRSVWLKGAPNGSGLLPSTQSLYIYYCKNFNIAIHIKSTILKLEKKPRNILEILCLLCILNMLNFKRLPLIASEI